MNYCNHCYCNGVAMEFYDRTEDLSILNVIYGQCVESYGKITVLTGRRRIGKTLLAQKYAADKANSLQRRVCIKNFMRIPG